MQLKGPQTIDAVATRHLRRLIYHPRGLPTSCRPADDRHLQNVVLRQRAASVVSAAENMQAVVFSDGNFQLQTLPRPEPRAGQVRIKVRAASVNPVDWKQAARAAAGDRLIPGRDLSGVIDAAGDAAGP